MKIKTKLRLGLGFLVVLIALLALLTIKQINLLALASENIIKDNKETLSYTRNMLKALDEMQYDETALPTIEKYLQMQKENITEMGENELTDSLSIHFLKLKHDITDETALSNMQAALYEIMELNLEAIENKNAIATKIAGKSIFIISILSLVCFIIAMVLFLKLPGNISNPIKELIASIKLIAANDYSQRVNFVTHDELGELASSFNAMAVKLDEYNRSNISKLLAEKKITETLINKIQYPIIGFNEHLKVNLVNEEFLKISGLNENEILEKHLLKVALKNELISQLIIMDSDNNMKDEIPGEKIRINSNGKDIYFEKEIQEILFIPYGEQQKRLLGYFIILKNITRYMELDLAKTNFIATISHELKTPISAIKFSLQLLENEKTGKLNQEQYELVKSCEEDSNNLLRITSELLNLTQIETGNIQLNIMPANLNEILQYAVDINKSFAEQKEIIVQTDCPAFLPEVYADKEKSAWVLINLISNAIRYSKENSLVKVQVLSTNKHQKVSITDSGKGIQPEYKDKIFDRYFRIPGTQEEGNGLGLAISKEFIEAQGGKITVESEYGIGSTFSVVFNIVSGL